MISEVKMTRLGLQSSVWAITCGWLLISSVVFGQTQKIGFPEVGGWEKGDAATYPTNELGYRVPYRSETGGIVTIYVYNGGNSKIAYGIEDEKVKAEITKAENDIKAYGEAGYYQDVMLVKNDTVVLGGNRGTTKALYSLFAFKVRGAEVDSEIYLFGYPNNFIKIRATRAKGKNGADNSEVEKLLTEVGKLFTK
jgi:hypothetical protein